MNYIFKGKTHSDTSNDYMLALGMNAEQIESVLNQMEFGKSQLEGKAKLTRDQALSVIELSGAKYDATSAALENITRTIRIADSFGYAEDKATGWRLANNTTRQTTLAELREIVALHDDKYVSVWNQFNEWVAGDKSEAFVFA